MDDKVRKYLFDINKAINNIDSYIGKEKLYDIYNSNPMLQDAVERNIEIIGEAMSKLLKLVPDINITNSRRVVDARNKIIHGYDEIDNTQIWSIIINHLPILKKEISEYLNDN